MNQNEKKNKATGVYVSIGIHAVMLLLFFVLLAWTEPDPPIPEYGIEFSMGNSLASNDQDDIPVSQPELDEVEEISEQEVVPEPAQEAESVAAEQNDSQEVETQDSQEESAITEDVNSADVVEQKVEEKEKKITKSEEPDTEKAEKTTETKVDTNKDVVKEKVEAEQEMEDLALMKKYEGGTGSGNKGPKLKLSGWNMGNFSKPKDNSTETGKIVFDIKINQYGEVENAKVKYTNVSIAVWRLYQAALFDHVFERKIDNRSTASTSTGTITFIIQSK